MTVVPARIRPHLVSFLYEYFPTHIEAKYRGKKVKSVQIRSNSPLGKYIRAMCVKADYPVKSVTYNFFFSVEESVSRGSVYAYKSGKYSFLSLPDEFVEDLNEMLEEIFRMNFFYFVEGYRQKNELGDRRDGIRAYIDKYDLLEHGFSIITLEKQFTRMKDEPWGSLVKRAK